MRGRVARIELVIFVMERKEMMGMATRAGGAARLTKKESQAKATMSPIGTSTYSNQ